MDGDGAEAAAVVNIMLQLFLLWIKMFDVPLPLLLGVSIAKKLFLLRTRLLLLLLLLYCSDDVCIRTWFISLLVPSRDDGLSCDILQREKEGLIVSNPSSLSWAQWGNINDLESEKALFPVFRSPTRLTSIGNLSQCLRRFKVHTMPYHLPRRLQRAHKCGPSPARANRLKVLISPT